MQGAKAIAELLKKNTIEFTVPTLTSHIWNLKLQLHLHGNYMGNEGIWALVSGLYAHRGIITLLDLENNEIGPKGAFHVAEYIKRTKSLLWLNLYMNDIGDEGTESIAGALKQNHSISTIDLVRLSSCLSSFASIQDFYITLLIRNYHAINFFSYL
ncbi:hypothetical protein KSP39_PZI021097 [Platanthera zijinensis]|uniref:Uncharacterized protein n=1 Tax=Platanthera zijinensis TaxID=2320716 RepID=A0AAP0AWQ1_9ASPA